ncbi:hypothetical protein ACWAU3_10965 [Shewanella sp. JL219SE-S6]
MSNNQDKHQSGTLSLKRTLEQSMSSLTSEQKVSVSGAQASEPVVNSMAQNTKTVKADKKDKQKEELSSLGKLLLLVFVPEKKMAKKKSLCSRKSCSRLCDS